MPRILTAILLALTLAPAVGCDEPDDKDTVERESDGRPDDFTLPEDTEGDTDGDTDGDDDDDYNDPPGCLRALPPSGGPATSLGDRC